MQAVPPTVIDLHIIDHRRTAAEPRIAGLSVGARTTQVHPSASAAGNRHAPHHAARIAIQLRRLAQVIPDAPMRDQMQTVVALRPTTVTRPLRLVIGAVVRVASPAPATMDHQIDDPGLLVPHIVVRVARVDVRDGVPVAVSNQEQHRPKLALAPQHHPIFQHQPGVPVPAAREEHHAAYQVPVVGLRSRRVNRRLNPRRSGSPWSSAPRRSAARQTEPDCLFRPRPHPAGLADPSGQSVPRDQSHQ